MANNKTIQVTPNVKRCLEALDAAVKSMPAGEKKDRAETAISYLSNTFEGEPQPGEGQVCPTQRLVIIP